jgi:hypothetical protein
MCAVLRLSLPVAAAVGKQVKRRSEVDRRLEQLVAKQSFRLKEPGQQSVIKVRRKQAGWGQGDWQADRHACCP